MTPERDVKWPPWSGIHSLYFSGVHIEAGQVEHPELLTAAPG